jgi:hypothetical protein
MAEQLTIEDTEVTAISKALAFFASAIKAGEPWGEQCDAMKRAAFSALDSLASRAESAALPPTEGGTNAE